MTNNRFTIVSRNVSSGVCRQKKPGRGFSTDCANQKRNAERCNCSYPGCPRHGVCCECTAYHRRMDELPACYFTAAEERTYNRSISYFVQSRR